MTVSSVIPTFSKRGDVIVADKAVNFAIKKGLQLSRSTILWFEHNDMEDLERVLSKILTDGAKKPLTRRFIVTEGLFEDVGDMSDLPKLVLYFSGLLHNNLLMNVCQDRLENTLQVSPHS